MLYWIDEKYFPHQPSALLCNRKECRTIAALEGVGGGRRRKYGVGEHYGHKAGTPCPRHWECFVCLACKRVR